MLLSSLTVMLGTYVGTRCVETYRSTRKENNHRAQYRLQNTQRLATVLIDNKISSTAEVEVVTDEKQVARKYEREANHYLMTGAAALGLSLFLNTSPLVKLAYLILIGYTATPNFRIAEDLLIRKKRFGNDFIKAMMVAICVGLGNYSIAAYDSCFYLLSSKLVAKARDNSKKKLSNAFGEIPEKAWVLRDGLEIEVPVQKISLEDIVIINAGEAVSVDGIIIHGDSLIDQRTLTGESIPAEKEPGDEVFAGTVVVSGRIQVQVKKTGNDITAAKISKILEESADFKTHIRLKGEKWADRVAAPLLFAGGVSLPFLGLSSATAIMGSSPGNRLKMFTSLQTLNHLNLASNKHILVKDGRALEEMSNVDTILFDKTGTLTEDELEVGQIFSIQAEYTEADIVYYAAAAEQKVAHPIAKAILQKAQELNLAIPKMNDSEYDIGHGIIVRIDDGTLFVGSLRFMEKQDILISDVMQEQIAQIHNAGHSFIVVALNHQLLGLIEICSKIRAETKKIISDLRQRGIKHMAVVSGDLEQPTKHVADSLGIDDYFYGVLPQHKAEIVAEFQEKGHKVCFVGDGINDTIAMQQADVSISLSGATTIATDVAQVVFIDSNLSHLCDLIDISKELDNNLQRTLLLLAGGGSVVFFGAYLFHWGIISSMIMSQFTILVESYRAARSMKKATADRPHDHLTFYQSFKKIVRWDKSHQA